ncbi:Heme transporter hrg-6 [Caenorhabditis elegans]|nr:Heme transporter hrg-6 [Caenorhabditis elegans]CBK19447.1 Heme transporter hrg-6 [Caenorhabditis elegans]|eukprot:NP_001255530.1 Heme transporter hrg-6 [Caenorhabditis elegans]
MLKWTWQNAFIARYYGKLLTKSIIHPEEPDDPSTWKF